MYVVQCWQGNLYRFGSSSALLLFLSVLSHVPMVFLCKFVKIHQLVHEMRVQTRLIFSLFSVVTLKIGSRSPKSNHFNYPNDTIHKVWPESVIWFKRLGADKLFLGQNLTFKVLVWPRK